jgi:CxxC motif-containing protein (DUF1111 family)
VAQPPPSAPGRVNLIALLVLASGLTGLLTGPAAGQRPQLPSLSFETDSQSVLEGAGTVRVRVVLSEVSTREVTVPLAYRGSARVRKDYKAPNRPVVIPAGALHADVLLRILADDLDDEDDEIAELVLLPPTGAVTANPARHKLRIQSTQLGDPIPGLSLKQLEAFARGQLIFNKRFTPGEGLGPFYNATSCASCHSTPVSGGGSGLYRNFYLGVYQFGATPASQSSAIPPFLSQVVPAYGSGNDHGSTVEFTLEGPRPLIPDTVFGFPVLSAQRNAIPVFGVGLFETISDATILSNIDPFDLDNNGISGRHNTQISGAAVGRLGLKAQANNIELFTRGPLQNQMGITSNPFEGAAGLASFRAAPLLMQVAADPNNPSTDADPAPDPEINRSDLGDLIAFGKFLAPPIKTPFDLSAQRGDLFFDQVGCSACHIPSLPASGGAVEAYSDLLLHDMGPALTDNIVLGDAASSWFEFRTQPLWGVSHFPPYLHDGRAATLEDAILQHGGEALAARTAFAALSAGDQADIINFLEHL